MEFTINTLLGISVILGALVIVGLLYGWVTQYALALGELGSGKLDPTIFEQALHVMVPPDCRFGVMIFGTVCLDADS